MSSPRIGHRNKVTSHGVADPRPSGTQPRPSHLRAGTDLDCQHNGEGNKISASDTLVTPPRSRCKFLRGFIGGENIVQESSRLPRFSLRLNPEPEVSPPWHSRPEDDRGDGAGAPPHGEGSLSRLCPPKNCYASLTLRMSGHYRKPSTDNDILGRRAQNVLSDAG